MADTDLATRARTLLTEERAGLLGQLVELGDDGDGAGFDDGHADSSQVSAEKGEVLVLVENLKAQLREVDRAIAKIDGDVPDASFGTCEECKEPIAADRLEAMPATRWCITHA